MWCIYENCWLLIINSTYADETNICNTGILTVSHILEDNSKKFGWLGGMVQSSLRGHNFRFEVWIVLCINEKRNKETLQATNKWCTYQDLQLMGPGWIEICCCTNNYCLQRVGSMWRIVVSLRYVCIHRKYMCVLPLSWSVSWVHCLFPQHAICTSSRNEICVYIHNFTSLLHET